MKVFKRIMIIFLILVLIVVLVVSGYVIFLSANYYRIEDNKKLTINGHANKTLSTAKEYSAMTYNIGFGAYSQNYSFFMDEGIMKDGTKVKGTNAKALSKEDAQKNTKGVVSVSKDSNDDFYLFQEVDKDSTRSYHIDQEKIIVDSLTTDRESINSTFGSNFHSVFLAYPFNDPIGSIESGLLTTSRYKMSQSVRRSFPVTDNFINKFFDLDRCFVVNRFSVDGKDISTNPHFVLINVHMSAYDKGGLIRKQQMKMLSEVLSEEMNAGNWVVVGGDFNHAIYGTEESFDSEQQIPQWVQPFDVNSLPKEITVVKANNIYDIPTVRGSDLPYEKGVNYLAVIDGFMVSPNVTAAAENVDTEFEYSDHNPVTLKFKLNKK